MFECDRKTSIMRWRWFPKGCVRHKKRGLNVFRRFLFTLKGTEESDRNKSDSKRRNDNQNRLEANRVPSN